MIDRLFYIYLLLLMALWMARDPPMWLNDTNVKKIRSIHTLLKKNHLNDETRPLGTKHLTQLLMLLCLPFFF